MEKRPNCEDFHRKIVVASLENYRKLPKRGKPTVEEWTPLSTVLYAQGSVKYKT